MVALLLVACALPSCWAAEDDSDEGDGYGAAAQPGAQPPAPPSGVKTLTGARTRPHLLAAFSLTVPPPPSQTTTSRPRLARSRTRLSLSFTVRAQLSFLPPRSRRRLTPLLRLSLIHI